MLGRIGLFESTGGDGVQIENTAKELRKLGITVEVKTGLSVDVSSYDLVHVFQLDWTPETYFYAKKIKCMEKPLILSPIHHNVSEVKKFDDEYAFDFRRVSRLLFKNQHSRDTFKNVYRSLFDFRKLGPTLASVFMGLENMHHKTLTLSDIVLVQTDKEASDLAETYKAKFDWEKVPNGVGDHFISASNYENKIGDSNYMIVVGRIEPRKNQLNIIKAVSRFRKNHNLDTKLVLIGRKSSKKHFEYMWQFNKLLAVNPWVIHLDYVPYAEMPSYYHFAKVGISASWFETTGLTSLEALFSGANAVASGDRAKEYLGDYVSYCDPWDVSSIEHAIEKEYMAKRPIIDDIMLKEYTWHNAAKKTLEVYRKVLT